MRTVLNCLLPHCYTGLLRGKLTCCESKGKPGFIYFSRPQIVNSVQRVTAFTLGFHMPPKQNTRCVIVPPEQLILKGRPENPQRYSASFQKSWGNQVAQALDAWTLSVLGRSEGREIPSVTLGYRAQEFLPAELPISQGKYLETYPCPSI